MPVIKHIPNTITALNLVCGCLSIISALNGELTMASMYIGVAAVLDFFDGFVARALKAYSDIGKQLDSLADMVSFGVAPGFIFYTMSLQGCEHGTGFCLIPYLAFLIIVFSAVRLANFNIDTRQSDSFIGVPTPANAMLIASMPFIMQENYHGLTSFLTNPLFFTIFPLVSAYLLVAELPLLALKFKNFGFKGNEFRFVLIIASVVSVAVFHYLGVAIAIVLYILISIIHNYTVRKNDKI